MLRTCRQFCREVVRGGHVPRRGDTGTRARGHAGHPDRLPWCRGPGRVARYGAEGLTGRGAAWGDIRPASNRRTRAIPSRRPHAGQVAGSRVAAVHRRPHPEHRRRTRGESVPASSGTVAGVRIISGSPPGAPGSPVRQRGVRHGAVRGHRFASSSLHRNFSFLRVGPS
jgi:hypothetical protein